MPTQSGQSLRERLSRYNQNSKDLKAPQCSLKSPKECCRGLGYVLDPQGPFLKAKLCSCVMSCPQCFGKLRVLSGEVSQDCKKAPPHILVNHINQAQIPRRYANASLSNFSNFTGNGKDVLFKLKTWTKNFRPTGKKGILLGGPVGVGKTFLLAALARELLKLGFTVKFTDFFHLLGDIRAGFAEGKSDSSHLAPLIDVDLLIIDELGKSRNRDFDKTVLDQLVSGRYNQNKTIIASTNYSLSGRTTHNVDLERFSTSSDFAPDVFGPLETRVGSRIFSRLKEMAVFVEMEGNDCRRIYGEARS